MWHVAEAEVRDELLADDALERVPELAAVLEVAHPRRLVVQAADANLGQFFI